MTAAAAAVDDVVGCCFLFSVLSYRILKMFLHSLVCVCMFVFVQSVEMTFCPKPSQRKPNYRHGYRALNGK